MIKLNALSAMLLAGITSVSYANSPPEELQPRDLDGDTSTIEAYYFPSQNLTWLADANIGLSETFGLERSEFFSDYGSEINQEGRMLREGLALFMQGMNDSRYLGHNQWRLPVAERNDPGCTVGFDYTFSFGENCSGPEVGEFNQFLNSSYGGISSSPFSIDSSLVSPPWPHWLSSSGPAGRHYFTFGGAGELRFCGSGRCGGHYVWPVHDGDIGTAVSSQSCIDTDPVGDGWGWNGVSSCRVIGGEPPVTTVCVDTDPAGDGWGWDGATSCRIDATEVEVEAANECVDSPPVGDGWGWDGATSCRIDAAEVEVEVEAANECIDSPPVGDGWGWNGITSCRVQNNSNGLTDVERFRSYQYCPDTSPIGDGWGWTGSESCRVESNLINNGDFSQGATDWITYVHPDAEETSFDLTRDLRLSYRDAGTQWWHSQAYTTPILLQGGRTYRLEFNYESGGNTGSAIGSVVVENGENYTAYLPRTDFYIGISAQRLQADFYVPVTDSNARVTFNLGDNAGGSNSLNIGTIWLDNIVLKEIN